MAILAGRGKGWACETRFSGHSVVLWVYGVVGWQLGLSPHTSIPGDTMPPCGSAQLPLPMSFQPLVLSGVFGASHTGSFILAQDFKGSTGS